MFTLEIIVQAILLGVTVSFGGFCWLMAALSDMSETDKQTHMAAGSVSLVLGFLASGYVAEGMVYLMSQVMV